MRKVKKMVKQGKDNEVKTIVIKPIGKIDIGVGAFNY